MTFTIDEARVLVDAVENHRNSGPPDAEGFIGRTPVDPERLPDAPVRAVFETAAAVLDDDRNDRPFDGDLAAAVRLVETGLTSSGRVS